MKKATNKICFQLFKSQSADQILLHLGTQENHNFMSMREVEGSKEHVNFYQGH